MDPDPRLEKIKCGSGFRLNKIFVPFPRAVVSFAFFSLGHPYPKVLDFSKLFVADAPMNKKSINLVLPPF